MSKTRELATLMVRRREQLELSQADVARRIGWSQSRIGNYESGVREPRLDDIVKISHALGIDMFHALSNYRSDNFRAAAKAIRRIPLVDWTQPAGIKRMGVASLLQKATTQYVDVYDSLQGPDTYALIVEGDSMSGPPGGMNFPAGTIIVVDPAIQPEAGKYVIAEDASTGYATFKQLMSDGGRWFLRPLNDSYPTREIPGLEYVLGVVVEWRISGRL